MYRPDELLARPPAATLGRREFLRGLAAAGAAAGAGGLLAACESGSAGGSGRASTGPAARPLARRPGGDLKLGMTGGGSTDTIDPNRGVTYLDFARCNSLYQPLVLLNAQAQPEYVLAESIAPYKAPPPSG